MSMRSDFWEHDPNYYFSCGLTGYTGTNPHQIIKMELSKALRIQIGERGLYKGSLAELPNGDLIATPCYSLEKNWPIHIFKSADAGNTWKKIKHTPLYGKEPGLTCTREGALILTLENKENTVAYSNNGGHDWHITNMNGCYQTVRTPILNTDGTINLIRCRGKSEGSPPDSEPSRVWIYHSFDGGKTWPEKEEKQTWNDSFPMFVEADFLKLSDNRILATSRFEYDHPIVGTKPPWPPKSVNNDHAAGHMVLFESVDEGFSWRGPKDFLNYSEVQGQLTMLSDGRIICTYTNYHLPFGVATVISKDMGKTWDLEHPIQLAVSNGINTGWPTTRQLSDGSLITVYAMEPYHLEPKEWGSMVFQCIKWSLD